MTLALRRTTSALCALCLTLFGGFPADASTPLPDYRAELIADEARALEQLNAALRFDEAVKRAKAFQEDVTVGGRISYELAFAYRALGEISASHRALEDAVDLNPALSFAWYDLGELALLDDDRRQAERAFAEAARLRPDHWAGFFRLAELAAADGDAQRFDALLAKAIRNGFDLRTVADDPRWKAWYADATLGEPLRRYLTVYWRDEVRRTFEAPAP